MSVVNIKTTMYFRGSPKTFVLVANDNLAEIIRRTYFTPVVINDIVSHAQYFTAIEPYVGDISDFAFPYSFETGDPDQPRLNVNWLTTAFPNSYDLAEVGPETHHTNVYEFNGKRCGMNTNYYAVYGCEMGLGMYANATALLHGTLFQDGEQNITVILPIFYESELADGKIHQLPANFAGLEIRYNRVTQVLTIGRTSDLGQSQYLNYFLDAEIPDPPRDDPYDPGHTGGNYSEPGGGPNPNGTGITGTGGLHDDTSDPISTPNPPSDVVISSGIFTAYNPSASQLASFANALWNMQPTDINDVLRFLFGGDAFNAIIGMHLLPVAPSVSGSQNIKLGNWDTGVSAPKISSQYAQVSFGSVLLPEYWGNCIDYAPYTRIQLALPYIGMVDVDTDDVLGSVNTLTYNIDVLSGALCAMLHCVKGNLTSVIYQWSGSCAVDLPITGANKNAIIGAIGASGVVTSMAFSAAGGGLLGGLAASAALAGSAASAYGTAKGKVQKNGNFGSHAGALGIMTPYFIVSRPVQSVPTTWQFDKGYPSNISAQLGTITGYTEVSEINLECSGTEAEKEEIIRLLKSGVIF